MPVNLIHSLLHTVEAGWDPIPRNYAESYAERVWNSYSEALVDKLNDLSGGLSGKRVLDLGAGPGQYSVSFAKRGARVVWHDISRNYQKLAADRALEHGVSLEFSLGYLEAARKFGSDSFDVVFSRVSWYYCRSDRKFARLIYTLVKPNGTCYIECDTPKKFDPKGLRRFQHWLNAYLWWKVGHPLPPHGRIANLFQKQRVSHIELDYASELQDKIFFVKAERSE